MSTVAGIVHIEQLEAGAFTPLFVVGRCAGELVLRRQQDAISKDRQRTYLARSSRMTSSPSSSTAVPSRSSSDAARAPHAARDRARRRRSRPTRRRCRGAGRPAAGAALWAAAGRAPGALRRSAWVRGNASADSLRGALARRYRRAQRGRSGRLARAPLAANARRGAHHRIDRARLHRQNRAKGVSAKFRDTASRTSVCKRAECVSKSRPCTAITRPIPPMLHRGSALSGGRDQPLTRPAVWLRARRRADPEAHGRR